MTSDKQIAQTFLSALYNIDDPKITIRMLSDKADSSGKKTPLSAKYGNFSDLWRYIEENNNNAFGAFFTPNMSDSEDTKDANINRSYSIFIDIDNGMYPSYFAIAPSAVLRRSDGGGYHIYWFLEETKDVNKWKAAIAQLIHYYKSDESVKNPARLMRIPGTVNHKREEQTIYEIQELNANRYKLDEVIYAHADKHNNKKMASAQIKALFSGRQIKDGEGRHEKMVQAAFILRDYGIEGNDALDAITKINEKYLIDKYPEEKLKSLVEAQQFAKGDFGGKAIEKELREAERRERVREAIKGYCYVRANDRFYNHKDRDQSITREGFGAKFASVAGLNNVSGFVFQNDLVSQYEKLEYEPGRERDLYYDGGMKLNMWQAPTLEAVDEKPEWFLNHLEYLIPEYAEREHFLNYLAYLVQNPGAKIMHAVLLTGKQGTGKSILKRICDQLFGDSNVVSPHNENLCGGFTGWAKHCQIVWINELSQIDKKDFNNKIKPFITEDKIEVREMYQAPYQIQNHLNIIAMSNHEAPLFIDKDDRRWFVIASPAEQKDPKYYCELIKNIENNSGSVLHYLLNRDLATFNAGEKPHMTRAKHNMIQYSRSDLEIWISESIENKDAPFENDFVCVSEAKDSLPYTLKNSFATSNRIGKILKDCGAEKIEDPVRIGDKTRRLWIVRNTKQYGNAIDRENAIKEIFGKAEKSFTVN